MYLKKYIYIIVQDILHRKKYDDYNQNL